jgi:hypothetical protein
MFRRSLVLVTYRGQWVPYTIAIHAIGFVQSLRIVMKWKGLAQNQAKERDVYCKKGNG